MNRGENLGELWGYVSKSRSRSCTQAEGGTILLQNIHDIPFNQQKHLVSLVTQKLHQPSGFTEAVRANLRLIVTPTKPPQ